jgi:hypothetical protein
VKLPDDGIYETETCSSEIKVKHKNIEPRIFFVVTVNPVTLTYCNTQEYAHREDRVIFLRSSTLI